MDPIRLIRDKDELEGTCYFEFLPGEYQEQCWNDGSVFLAEDVFGLIEPIIERHEPQFDHCSFVGIQRHVWERIIADLERLAERAEGASGVADLAGDVGYFFTTTEAEFAREFRSNADALARMARTGELGTRPTARTRMRLSLGHVTGEPAVSPDCRGR